MLLCGGQNLAYDVNNCIFDVFEARLTFEFSMFRPYASSRSESTRGPGNHDKLKKFRFKDKYAV